MKTKEQIIGSKPQVAGGQGHDLYMKVTHVSEVMDEYSKQQCIAYAHYIFKKLYPAMMVGTEPPNEESEILYNQFIESQTNTPPKTTE